MQIPWQQGKNSFIEKVSWEALVAVVMSHSLWLQLYGLYPTRLLCQLDSQSKNTRMGCPPLLQGIFPTQGSNLQIESTSLTSPALAGRFLFFFYHYHHLGSPYSSWLFTGWVLARKEQSSFFLLGSISVTGHKGFPFWSSISNWNFCY